jgi:serine/threonine protein kinase
MSNVLIGHYRLLEQIGTGGLGDVYRARDTRLGRTVAVKVPPAELVADPARREALLRQARAVARLSHPSIATLFDVGEDGDQPYLVFEYVPGESLNRVIGGHPLNPRRAVEIGIQLADGLADAHAQNLAHGDIRPETVMITPKDRAKLLDFGMAAFTRGGAAGAGQERETVDDIFALGCVLFEMLTGRQAFRHGTGEPAFRQSGISRAVPDELDPIVARALSPDPDARYLSAATLSAELRGVAAILDIRTAAREADILDVAPSRAHRGIVWLLALLVLGGALVGLWSWRDEVRTQWRRWFGPPAVASAFPTAEEFRPALR